MLCSDMLISMLNAAVNLLHWAHVFDCLSHAHFWIIFHIPCWMLDIKILLVFLIYRAGSQTFTAHYFRQSADHPICITKKFQNLPSDKSIKLDGFYLDVYFFLLLPQPSFIQNKIALWIQKWNSVFATASIFFFLCQGKHCIRPNDSTVGKDVTTKGACYESSSH